MLSLHLFCACLYCSKIIQGTVGARLFFGAIYVKKIKIKEYKIKNNMKFSLHLVISEFLRLHVRVEFV